MIDGVKVKEPTVVADGRGSRGTQVRSLVQINAQAGSRRGKGVYP